jgi:transposase-like protein
LRTDAAMSRLPSVAQVAATGRPPLAIASALGPGRAREVLTPLAAAALHVPDSGERARADARSVRPGGRRARLARMHGGHPPRVARRHERARLRATHLRVVPSVPLPSFCSRRLRRANCDKRTTIAARTTATSLPREAPRPSPPRITTYRARSVPITKTAPQDHSSARSRQPRDSRSKGGPVDIVRLQIH